MRTPSRRGARAGAIVLTALGLVLGAGAALAGPAVSVPTDPQAHGFVAFCGPTGSPVTGGSLATKPFVWTAISSVPPASSYSGKGQNADLSIYQERPDVLPAEWSGTQLVAETLYSSADYPTAQSTRDDLSLNQVVLQYPPAGDGLYEIRMQYGREGYGVDGGGYAATTIQVTGKSWHVVAGGTIACSHGKGTSSEVLTGVAPSAPAPSYAAEVASAQQSNGSSSDTTSHPLAGASVGAPTTSASASAGAQESVITPTASSSHGGGGSVALPVTPGVVGGVLVLGAGAVFWRRRST